MDPSPAIAVRLAVVEDIALVADIAASGFYDDPVFSWVLPDPDTRLSKLASLFRSIARDMLPARGEIHLAEAASTSMWRDPSFDHHEDGKGEFFEPDVFSPEDFERLGMLRAGMLAAHPRDPHWYLSVLSTLPLRQSQGFGAAAMSVVLARCDAEVVPAYLASTNPKNRTLYRRHGFVDGDEIAIGDGPTALQMWREPRP